MKLTFLSSLALSLGLLAPPDAFTQTVIPVSFYPARDIQAILAQPGCQGVRVYPVFDDLRQANSTMLIGIDENGNELNNDSSAVSQYRMFSGVNEDIPTSRGLTRDEARNACSAFNANHSAFVSDLGASLLAGHMGEESLGIMLSYSNANGNNFQASGFRSNNGLQGVGAASPGDPCPTNCGSRSQYLCSPL